MKFLFISDLHIKDISEFGKKIKTLFSKCVKPESIDFVLIGGDFLSLKIEERKDPLIIENAHKIIYECLSFISFYNKNILYIPGNHDPDSFFGEHYKKKVSFGENLHKKIKKIGDSLYICGYGGSPKGISSLNGEEVWSEYPIGIEKDFGEYVKKIDIKSQMICLTHFGPTDCQTSLYPKQDSFIKSGMKDLNKLILEKDEIFLNLHGHCHLSEGRIKLNKSTIVMNCGPFKNGFFSTFEVKRNEDGMYYLFSSNFCKIE